MPLALLNALVVLGLVLGVCLICLVPLGTRRTLSRGDVTTSLLFGVLIAIYTSVFIIKMSSGPIVLWLMIMETLACLMIYSRDYSPRVLWTKIALVSVFLIVCGHLMVLLRP